MEMKRKKEANRIISDYDPALADAILSTREYSDEEIEALYRELHKKTLPLIKGE
jgi:hypothetical protein